MMRAKYLVGFVSLALASLALGAGPGSAQPAPRRTADGALAADDALTLAIRNNDADAIASLLDKDWAVISTAGGVGEGPAIFPSGIKSGFLVRKTFDTSEPRVRVFGDTAVVTTKVKTSGTLQGKPFDVAERQTDVWIWKDGAWRCVLTHETKMP
jgi:ketosteroid isomerase-like protein